MESAAYILNPKTNRMVLREGRVGRALERMESRSESESDTATEGTSAAPSEVSSESEDESSSLDSDANSTGTDLSESESGMSSDESTDRPSSPASPQIKTFSLDGNIVPFTREASLRRRAHTHSAPRGTPSPGT